MASKQVTQHACDRCKRIWYVDVGAKAVATTVCIEADLDGVQLSVKHDCLCAGCRSTVKGLLEQIAKTIEKASPIRTAKKKDKRTAAAEVTPPPAAVPSPPMKPPPPSVVVAPAALTAVSASAARSGGVPAHPTR